ncbi:hypothetical protein V8C26DRAFT_124850 [Trichoderma gracile]
MASRLGLSRVRVVPRPLISPLSGWWVVMALCCDGVISCEGSHQGCKTDGRSRMSATCGLLGASFCQQRSYVCPLMDLMCLGHYKTENFQRGFLFRQWPIWATSRCRDSSGQ